MRRSYSALLGANTFVAFVGINGGELTPRRGEDLLRRFGPTSTTLGRGQKNSRDARIRAVLHFLRRVGV